MSGAATAAAPARRGADVGADVVAGPPVGPADGAVAAGGAAGARPDRNVGQRRRGDRVAAGCSARGQTEKLTAWLWEPLALAALNQSPDEALATPFVRVLAEMFGPDRGASAIALPLRPLHEMYAEPARAFIEQPRRGGAHRRAGARGDGRHARDRRRRARRAHRDPRVVAAVPWFGMRTLFAPPVPPPLARLVADAGAMGSKPIVTVNLWYDRRVMEEPFVGLPGRAMQWVFDKRLAFGRETSHLSLVASGADALASERTDDARRARRPRSRRGDPRRARRDARPRHGHPREARDVLARRRSARPAGGRHRHRRSLARRRLDRHGTAGHDRERGGERPRGGSAAMLNAER